MRIAPILAAALVALPLTSGLAGPAPSLAHPSQNLPATGYIFAGLFDGHIYRTADGGTTWQEADAGLQTERAPVNRLAVAPDGATLYAATQRGLWSSGDDGGHWGPAGAGAIAPDANVTGVAVDPLDGLHVYAVTDAGSFFESKDGGRTWSSRMVPRGYSTLALDPQRPGTLLIGSLGLLVSADGGATWTQATGVAQSAGIPDVTFDPRHPDVAYAADTDGIYRSADGRGRGSCGCG
jgi:photosystem II stability/assembly factor-like uncharacterized protein